MKFITVEKLRAARALLNWKQSDLAKHSGVPMSSLSKLESGQYKSIKESTAIRLLTAFNVHGIEITETHVGFIQNKVASYVGKDGFAQFFDEVYMTVKDGGEICVSNVDESQFLKWEGDRADMHTARMSAIEGLDFKVLVEEGDKNLAGSDYVEYRWMPADKFDDIPLYIYGGKVALIVFSENNVEIFSIQHPGIAGFFKCRFLANWAMASKSIK